MAREQIARHIGGGLVLHDQHGRIWARTQRRHAIERQRPSWHVPEAGAAVADRRQIDDAALVFLDKAGHGEGVVVVPPVHGLAVLGMSQMREIARAHGRLITMGCGSDMRLSPRRRRMARLTTATSETPVRSPAAALPRDAGPTKRPFQPSTEATPAADGLILKSIYYSSKEDNRNRHHSCEIWTIAMPVPAAVWGTLPGRCAPETPADEDRVLQAAVRCKRHQRIGVGWQAIARNIPGIGGSAMAG